MTWAERFPERTWAVENATGLGYVLAQQLVAAGERVLDVQPKLAARVRLLVAETTKNNDPHDALSVAIAALRSPTPKVVGVEDHAAVVKLWARRHRDLSSPRTQVACRLHAVLCDLVAGGVPDETYTEKAASLLADVEADSAVAAARVELAHELLDDLRPVDRQLAESKKRLSQVVAASRTSVIDIFGVGPVVAATVVGITGDIARFPTRDRSAAFNGTAHIAVLRGPQGVAALPPREPHPQPRHPHGRRHPAGFHHSPGHSFYDRKITEGKTPKESLRALKRRISDALWVAMVADARGAAAATAKSAHWRAREGTRGTALSPARPALTPIHRLFGQATPEPDRRLRPPSPARVAPRRERPPRHPEELLDNQRGLVRCDRDSLSERC